MTTGEGILMSGVGVEHAADCRLERGEVMFARGEGGLACADRSWRVEKQPRPPAAGTRAWRWTGSGHPTSLSAYHPAVDELR
jgi:hypothetical protein